MKNDETLAKAIWRAFKKYISLIYNNKDFRFHTYKKLLNWQLGQFMETLNGYQVNLDFGLILSFDNKRMICTNFSGLIKHRRG